MSDINVSAGTDWESRLGAVLALFGHRNWIVVADAAYPAQSAAGIDTVVADADQLDVVRTMVKAVAARNHIRARVHLDAELQFVPEQDAPGVTAYARQLEVLLDGSDVCRMPHEQLIAKLELAARMFRVLIIKTQLTIPYTSVFFELDCGYWNADAERHLRAAIEESAAMPGAAG